MEKKQVTCPQCGYSFEMADAVRCPRCYAILFKQMDCAGNCRDCKEKRTIREKCST